MMDTSPLPIEILGKARLLPGAVRVTEGQDSETWKGTLVDEENGRLNAYVKRQSAPAMLAEIVSALVGRALGLPIPRPFVVLISRSALPQSRHWEPEDVAALAFALEDARAVSFKRYVERHALGDAEIFSRLKAWDRLQEMLCLDEWLANTDRHLGNLLFDGEFWLIDHGRAFNVPRWPREPLHAARLYDSRLSDMLMGTLSEHERYQWRKVGIAFEQRCARVPAGDTPRQLVAFVDPELANDAAVFLASRASCLVQLLCQRLRIPELNLASSS